MSSMQSVMTASQTSERRQHQLLEIIADAARNVLERPDSRRGPYVIADSELRVREESPR